MGGMVRFVSRFRGSPDSASAEFVHPGFDEEVCVLQLSLKGYWRALDERRPTQVCEVVEMVNFVKPTWLFCQPIFHYSGMRPIII